MGRGKKFKLAKAKSKIPASVPSSSSPAPPWTELPRDLTANFSKIPASVASTSSPPPPWTELPRDITANILHRLGAVDILQNARRVCTTWRSVCQDPAMWRVIDMKDDEHLHEMAYDLLIMCRHAVDLSQGQLIDFYIECDFTEELLHYIAERSSQLKRLTLSHCCEISGKGLSEAVKKFPLLEELHLFFLPSIRAADIESIGRSCPMLKSFTFTGGGYGFPFTEEGNEYAVAVAETMPGLHHLQFFGNKMTNDGLQAILDSCPNLESLDLRQCINVVLEGDLGNKCSQRIKNLRRPTDDFTDDKKLGAEIHDHESLVDDYYPSDYSDIHSIGDYDDYTNPFSSEYYSDPEALLFDALYISEFDTSYI